MKQLMLTVLAAGLLLVTFESNAQDQKTKTKDEKVKTKSDGQKEKWDGDETKVKKGDYKKKMDGDEVKMKQGDNKQKMDGDDQKIKMDIVNSGSGNNAMADMPYVADYSSSFAIGNPEHAKKVLELWKDYDNNNFQLHAGYFSDTVMFTTSDGQVMRGKDSALSALSRYRSTLSNVKSTLDAWIPLKSLDRDADWVAVWGTETATDSQGKTTTIALHEVWSFNKAGKISYMRQYTGQMPKL